MSWIDLSVGSGSSGSGSSNNLLSGLINSLGNALSNASSSGGIRGFPWQAGNENDQIVGYYDDPQGYYSVIKKFLAEKNYHSNERLKSAFERIINIQNRINSLNHEIAGIQNRINSLNNEIDNLNHQIQEQDQALNHLNQEIQGLKDLNHEINANANALKKEQEKLNALELQTNAKKQVEKEIKESLKKLENLKKELKRLKKQSRWKKEFNFLTDNPPNIQANQESALNRASSKSALVNFFLTDPYAILPKGFIYEYHNPGKVTYNALNAPNNMDGINNRFRVNALNQVLDNSYQKFLPGNDSYNALRDIEQVKALKFYDLVLNFNAQSEKLENALFFKQISQYAKGLRLKILTAPSNKKDLQRLEILENTLKKEEERLKGKDLNTLMKEIEKEQEIVKAKQNHAETLKNAVNQKEHAKNPIEQQKQTLESQRNEKEQQKQTLESQRNEKEQQKRNIENAKRNQEQERNNLNNEINAIGNERITFKELGTNDNFLGIQPYLNDNGRRRTYARAFFSDKSKSVREYYELETKIRNILGFYRIGQSDEVISKRFLELSPQQQNEIARLILG
ncbi:UV radiation resistance protein [Helicobacter pylori]